MSAYDPKQAFEPLGDCSTVTFKVRAGRFDCDEIPNAFAIRQSGKIGGVGVVAKTIA